MPASSIIIHQKTQNKSIVWRVTKKRAPAIRGFSHHGITLKFSFQNLENLLKSQFFSSFWSVLGHESGGIHELLVRTPPNNEKRFENFHRSFQTVKTLYHITTTCNPISAKIRKSRAKSGAPPVSTAIPFCAFRHFEV